MYEMKKGLPFLGAAFGSVKKLYDTRLSRGSYNRGILVGILGGTKQMQD